MKLPRLKELSLAKVTNGWIVKIIYGGESSFKEPYDEFKPLMVFETHEKAMQYIQTWMVGHERKMDSKKETSNDYK